MSEDTERLLEQAREDLREVSFKYQQLREEVEAKRPHKMGPLASDHPLTLSADPCQACKEFFYSGQYVTLIQLGPANDPEARERARTGRPYNALALPIHWACATGEEES